ncbi:MAG: glycoside hydrolase family 3 protein [Caldilineaceae bacterium]
MPHQFNSQPINRRTLLRSAGQIAFLSLLSSCAPAASLSPNAVLQPVTSFNRTVTAPPLPAIQPTLATRSVPLAHKIGQMIATGFSGATLTTNSPILQDIRTYHLGGIFLFARNVADKAQMTTLTRQLQAEAAIPLTIAIDHEGGLVRRMGASFGFTSNYTAQALGDIDDLETTRTFGREIAFALAEMGINHNLAPVVDVNVNARNPVIGGIGRSFSADPEQVVRHATAFIEAHHEAGVLCTLKHFPGHGSSTADSHAGFVDVTDTWSERELIPFQEIIQNGRCDAVMTAHIFNANLDAELPATLSKAVITGILRQQLGYDGVIMTDDLQMGAIQRYYDLETVVETALTAGVDMLSLSKYAPNSIATIVRTIEALVEAGKVSEERIDESYRRILAMKARIGVPIEYKAPLEVAQQDQGGSVGSAQPSQIPEGEPALENFRY